MCSKEDINKIDSGKFVVVSKWEHYIKLWTPLLSFLGLVIAATVWKTEIEQRTFDDVRQKQEALYFLSQEQVITEAEKAELDSHMHNSDIHATTVERMQLFIPRSEMKVILEAINDNLKRIIENQK